MVAPVEVEEQGHRCPLPRGGRARVKTRMAALQKEEVAVLAPDTLQGNQRTGAVEGMALVETEEIATGKRRTRRSARSKMKMALDQKGEDKFSLSLIDLDCLNADFQKSAIKSPSFIVIGKCKLAIVGKHFLMIILEFVADSSDVAIGSSAVVSEKDCDDPKTHSMILVVEEDFTKSQNVTKTHVVHEMEEVPAPAILRRSQRTAVPVEAEEVGTAKKGTRRSTRSKMAAAVPKGQKGEHKVSLPLINFDCWNADFDADFLFINSLKFQICRLDIVHEHSLITMSICADHSSEVAIGSADKSCDRPKEDEVVAVVEEQATKPLEGGNETRRTVAYRMDMLAPVTLQRSQRTSAPEATVPVEAEEVATTKRMRRAKSKAARAALNMKKSEELLFRCFP